MEINAQVEHIAKDPDDASKGYDAVVTYHIVDAKGKVIEELDEAQFIARHDQLAGSGDPAYDEMHLVLINRELIPDDRPVTVVADLVADLAAPITTTPNALASVIAKAVTSALADLGVVVPG